MQLDCVPQVYYSILFCGLMYSIVFLTHSDEQSIPKIFWKILTLLNWKIFEFIKIYLASIMSLRHFS